MKTKILQFPIADSFGGITHYALNNWKWMNKELFDCDFATMSKSLFFAPELEKTGSRIHYISCYAEQNKEQFAKEFNAILDNGYDVVHLHTKHKYEHFYRNSMLQIFADEMMTNVEYYNYLSYGTNGRRNIITAFTVAENFLRAD